jgi:hypothetical protein
VSESESQSYLLLRHLLEKVDKLYERVDEITGHKNKVESNEKRINDHEKRLREHESSIANLQFEQGKRNEMKVVWMHPAAKIVIGIVIGALITGGTTSLLTVNKDAEHFNISHK